MIPIKDTIHSKTFPIINWLLVIANVLVFVLIELPLGQNQLNQFISTYGMTPNACAAPILNSLTGGASPSQSTLLHGCVIPLITSMFIHGGWLHIIGNMWVLIIFGDNVEDRMGSLGYLVFYMVCGLISGLRGNCGGAGSLPVTFPALKGVNPGSHFHHPLVHEHSSGDFYRHLVPAAVL